MIELLNNMIYILSAIFYGFIFLGITNYILSSIFFVFPMNHKYDILNLKLNNTLTTRKVIIFVCLILILLTLSILSIISDYFEILLTIYIFYIVYKSFKYSKYDLLNYINYYSSDIFDWKKIYNLNVSEEIKVKCFSIHHKNYYYYKNSELQKG